MTEELIGYHGYELSIVQIGSRWKVLIIPRHPGLPGPGDSERFISWADKDEAISEAQRIVDALAGSVDPWG